MKRKKKILLVIAVLLLIGLAIGAFLYLKKKKDTAGSAPANGGALPSNEPVLTAEDQVKQLFRTILGREADPEGLRYWTTYLESSDYETVKNHFFNSPEYLAKRA
jgi:hypothetical protein